MPFQPLQFHQFTLSAVDFQPLAFEKSQAIEMDVVETATGLEKHDCHAMILP